MQEIEKRLKQIFEERISKSDVDLSSDFLIESIENRVKSIFTEKFVRTKKKMFNLKEKNFSLTVFSRKKSSFDRSNREIVWKI